ncbi:hypothetical protein PCASD_15042 [Puccinia coronata f. sp. avenae]|uniref:Uncharacterized protein n=1 Tax=Puccinia coronata f. sp. avenae TaxID=200324 RepID=A0A2N5U906_9BASI|nr:hypothetical protein PCASD_15042 [Puccinia coronata f. sp. avenae]
MAPTPSKQTNGDSETTAELRQPPDSLQSEASEALYGVDGCNDQGVEEAADPDGEGCSSSLSELSDASESDASPSKTPHKPACKLARKPAHKPSRKPARKLARKTGL